LHRDAGAEFVIADDVQPPPELAYQRRRTE
jgi:hypothetical protein